MRLCRGETDLHFFMFLIRSAQNSVSSGMQDVELQSGEDVFVSWVEDPSNFRVTSLLLLTYCSLIPIVTLLAGVLTYRKLH